MANLYALEEKNIWKTWTLMALFFIVVIGLGWYFSFALGNRLILYAAVIFSVLMNVLSYWYSDKIVLRMAGARPLSKNDNPTLFHVVENLSITAGLPPPKL